LTYSKPCMSNYRLMSTLNTTDDPVVSGLRRRQRR
jgi:hypothetical protein